MSHATFGWDGEDIYRCRCGAAVTKTPGASWADPLPGWARHVAAMLAAAGLLADPDATEATAARARREALEDVLRALDVKREEAWGDYIGGPGGRTEALLQGRFDGLVSAATIVRAVRDTAEPATEVRDGE
jgi:hypothetical protein